MMRERCGRRNGMMTMSVVAVAMLLYCCVAFHRPGERNTRGAIGAIQQDDVVLRKILENQQSSVGDTSMQDVRDNSLRGLRQSAESEAPALDIFAASKAGDVAALKALIGDDLVNPNEVSANEGITPLIYAASYGHTEAVEELIVLGAKVSTAIKTGITALWVATLEGHKDVCEVLLDNGAEVNRADDDGTTPLYVAALRAHDDVVKLLLRQGADFDARATSGATPLMAAVHSQNRDIVKILLQEGADPNLNKTISGQTMLWTAAYLKNAEIIKELVGNRAKLDVPAADGTTPLMISIMRECLDCAAFLLEEGADPNVKRGTDLWTPLHMAAANVYIEGAELLVDSNAKKDVRDSIQRRPIDVIGRLKTPSDNDKTILIELLRDVPAVVSSESIASLRAVPGNLTTDRVEKVDSVKKSSIGTWAVAALIVLACLVAFQAMYIYVVRRKRSRYAVSERSVASPMRPLQPRLSTQSYVPTSPVTVVSPQAHHSRGSSSMDNPFSPTQNVPPAPDSPETHRPAGHPVLESLPSDYESYQGRSTRSGAVDLEHVHQLYSTTEGPYDGFGNYVTGYGALRVKC